MLNQIENEIPQIIPIRSLCKSLGCTPRSLDGYVERHGIPLVELSPKKRGLTPENFKLLLDRATAKTKGSQVKAGLGS